MATPAWKVAGRYYETCRCDFLCPCILTQLQGQPSRGSCTFAMGFSIEQGRFGDVTLDGLGFMIVGFTPEEMGKGNWSAGVIVDERADAAQRDAIVAVATGAAGGPMGALSGLITNFAGVETGSIRFEADGVRWSVTASDLVQMSAEPAMGIDPGSSSPLHLAHTGHPASSDLWLARAVHSQVNVFGLSWSDTSGQNNGQYAPFTWSGA